MSKVTQSVNHGPKPKQDDLGEGGSFLCCLHYAEKQWVSNLGHQTPEGCAQTKPAWTAPARREEFPGTWTGQTPEVLAVASAGQHEVRAARSRFPRAPHQKMKNTHHKREGKSLPRRNRQPWQVLDSGERRLPSPTQGRWSYPEDAG